MLAHPFFLKVALGNAPIGFLQIVQSLGSSITAQVAQAQSKRTMWISADLLKATWVFADLVQRSHAFLLT